AQRLGAGGKPRNAVVTTGARRLRGGARRSQPGSSRSGGASERPFLPRGRRGAENAEWAPGRPHGSVGATAAPTSAPTVVPPAHLSALSAPLGTLRNDHRLRSGDRRAARPKIQAPPTRR